MLETLTQVAADYIREWTLLKVRLVLEREWFYQFAISENVLAKGCLHICKHRRCLSYKVDLVLRKSQPSSETSI